MRYGLLGALVSALAMYAIAARIDFASFNDAWKAARYGFIIPSAVLLLLGLVTRAVRWRVLLSDGLALRPAFHIMNIAYLINAFVPFRIGELARAFLGARANPPVKAMTTVGTIVVERLLDLLAVVIMLAVALAAGPVPDWLRVAGISSGIMALAGFLFLVALSRRRELAHRVLGAFEARLTWLERLHLSKFGDHFLDGLLPLAEARTLASALFWTGLSWFLSLAGSYVLMYTFYDDASWAVTCLFIAAAALAVAVPAVPGNVGTYEAAILVALAAVGYADNISIATAFAVTVHVTNVAIIAVTGLIGFVDIGVSLEQLSEGVRRVARTAEVNEAGSI
jgi:hypothetical protein